MLKRLSAYGGGPLLYLIVTPLGNLKDIPSRVVDALKEARHIYAEDTRNARKLLSHLGIEGKSLSSIRSQNEKETAATVIDRLLEEGGSIAYMSDAGHPCLSDPGSELVRSAKEKGASITIVPATSAALAAYCLSGFSSPRFYFQGFLPLARRERMAIFEAIRTRKEATIIYEAPTRIEKTLSDLAGVVEGSRRISLSREISKIHEETVDGSLEEFLTIEKGTLRGEIAFVVAGSAQGEKEKPTVDLDAYMKGHLALGKEAVKAAMEELGVGRKEAYEAYLKARG